MREMLIEKVEMLRRLKMEKEQEIQERERLNARDRYLLDVVEADIIKTSSALRFGSLSA